MALVHLAHSSLIEVPSIALFGGFPTRPAEKRSRHLFCPSARSSIMAYVMTKIESLLLRNMFVSVLRNLSLPAQQQIL